MSEAPTEVCTVETHMVLAAPATVWKHSDGSVTVEYGTPYLLDEIPFPVHDGVLWDPVLEDWMTSTRLADTYGIPYPSAVQVAIGPPVTLTVEQEGSPDGGE